MISGNMFNRKRQSGTDEENPYISFRKRVFLLHPNELEMKAADKDSPYGIIMETGYPNAIATLASFIDGNAGFCLSTGGVVNGGNSHENISQAAKSFVISSKEFINSMSITEEYPLPAPGNTRFYILTENSIYTHEEKEEDLGYERSKVSRLFLMGHEVLLQLRMVTPH